MSTATATAELTVLRHDEAGVATVTLNRPKQYNSLSRGLLDALQATLDGIADDSSIRVVILAANGPAFCAGHDLREMRSRSDREFHQALFTQCSRLMLTLQRLPQPVIAQVNGIATAAGCQLVATCDLAVAAASARFAVSGINVGLFCSTPSVALSRNIARKQAMEMLLTGEFIDAETARTYGLINRVVADADLAEATSAMARTIAAKSSLAVTTGKQMFYRQLGMPLEQAYEYAAETMACNMDSHDAREGVDAFFGKRAPQWRGY